MHPQFACRSDTTEIVFARLNPGATYTAAGATQLLDKILAAVSEGARVLRLRADSGWYMKDFLAACEASQGLKILYYITADQYAKLVAGVAEIPETAWEQFSAEEVAAFSYQH